MCVGDLNASAVKLREYDHITVVTLANNHDEKVQDLKAIDNEKW